jgi:hypothetical protein
MRLVKSRDSERGFALLIVFLMAAAVAFTFYAQMPRVAFESAREREQLLMDRGNEYKRAIQVYYAVNKRYPAKLEDLENTNEKRYLRRRYKDPMTGKDEWRMVHTNGSYLTDSLVEKPPAQNAQSGLPGGGPLGANNLNTASPSLNNGTNADPNNPAGGPVAVNAAVAARPSDRVFTPDQVQPQFGRGGFQGGGFPGFNGQPPNNALGGIQSNPSGTYDPSDPRTWPAISTMTPGQNGQAENGQPVNGPTGALGPTFQQNQNQNPAFPNQNQPFQNPAFPAFPNQPQINTPGIPGQAAGLGGLNPQPLNFGGALQQQMGQSQFNQPQFNQPQFNQPQFNQPQPGANLTGPPPNQVTFPGVDGSNAALGLINNQLTQGGGGAAGSNPNNSPNAFPNTPFGAGPGIAGTAGQGTATGATANGGGPGIAGVASTHQGPSIKSYHERTKYQEWEFVYKPQQGAGANPNQPNPNQVNPNQNGLNPPQNGGLNNPNNSPIFPSSPANPNPFGQQIPGQ